MVSDTSLLVAMENSKKRDPKTEIHGDFRDDLSTEFLASAVPMVRDEVPGKPVAQPARAVTGISQVRSSELQYGKH